MQAMMTATTRATTALDLALVQALAVVVALLHISQVDNPWLLMPLLSDADQSLFPCMRYLPEAFLCAEDHYRA